MKQKYPYVLIAAFLICFWMRGSSILDPDFGWHIRMGQLILSHGIPKTDPFSYTMPSFHLVDHEWLANIFLAKVFPLLGFGWLSFLFTLLALSSLLLQLYFLDKRWIRIPFLLAAAVF